jgi:hypothetical protein
MQERNLEEISSCIDTIQRYEKEKLLLTAAMHLEIIRQSSPSYTEIFGHQIPNHDETMQGKISSLEVKIREVMEQIQISKCDLIT